MPVGRRKQSQSIVAVIQSVPNEYTTSVSYGNTQSHGTMKGLYQPKLYDILTYMAYRGTEGRQQTVQHVQEQP